MNVQIYKPVVSAPPGTRAAFILEDEPFYVKVDAWVLDTCEDGDLIIRAFAPYQTSDNYCSRINEIENLTGATFVRFCAPEEELSAEETKGAVNRLSQLKEPF